MASELLGTLEARRSAVETGGQTWESAPSDSRADASHFKGMEFGKTPAAAEWMKGKVADTPEEDAGNDMIEALDDVLKTRGSRPTHAPAPVTSEDEHRLTEMSNTLISLQRIKLQERGQLEQEHAEVANHEAKVKALEEQLNSEKKHQLSQAEELRNYPHPQWLEKYEGTINVAVSGNSGVGKSSLINRIRRLKPGAHLAAPVGVKETTLAPTMYAFPGRDDIRLWDLPGADTENFPREAYVRTMGLRYFDSVLIVCAGRFTTTEIELRRELEQYGVPFSMVRTKVDIDIYNNNIDNKASEETTLATIRADMTQQHGAPRSYLVSARDPEKYDLPLLLREAFPGLKQALDRRLDANARVFEPGESTGWGENWSLEFCWGTLLSGIQGQWQDCVDGCMYIIDGNEVHVTLSDGRAAVVTVTEEADASAIWWNNRWSVDPASIAKARETGELRWTPANLIDKPLVWQWVL